mmetsp:Transcript_22814/g.22040  ORF Transcript_22814/g.22040 Transcript_22814/m.22040 type:complete len:86 (-) Transcript_22814:286-543(-)
MSKQTMSFQGEAAMAAFARDNPPMSIQENDSDDKSQKNPVGMSMFSSIGASSGRQIGSSSKRMVGINQQQQMQQKATVEPHQTDI